MTKSFRESIERVLGVPSAHKPEIYLQVFTSADVASANYILELLLSAGIATLGLVLNSPAVVIGAMLISPLMGPILAGGLALAASDLYLGIKSALSVMVGIAVSLAFSAFLVWLLPFHEVTGEILARTRPNLLDLGVALFSGLAGSIVVSRGGGGGGVTALPGVAIAVALMPPLCTVGFGIGSGWSWPIISGAGLLFVTNLAAIMASAFLVFFLLRFDAPSLRGAISQAAIAKASPELLYRLLGHTRLSPSLGTIGAPRWRVLMLLVTLLILFVPLRQSLYQVRDEAIGRTAVRDAVTSITSPDSLLSQQVSVEPQHISVHLIVTAAVTAGQIRQAEDLVMRRTGKAITIDVRKVASDEELEQLRARLQPAPPPAPPPPPPPTLDELAADVRARLDAPFRELWPADTATLTDYQIGIDTAGVMVVARYEAKAPLDAAVADVLARSLQTRLKTAGLRVSLEYQPPAKPRRAPAPKRNE